MSHLQKSTSQLLADLAQVKAHGLSEGVAAGCEAEGFESHWGRIWSLLLIAETCSTIREVRRLVNAGRPLIVSNN